MTPAAEAMEIAQNLARNLGWPVFPCGLETKAPTRPKHKGGNGFKDATTDPDEIAWLWHHWPGALHALGICNTQSKLAYGVDSRGDLEYIAFWYGAGFECLDHAPLAPWPDWLRDCLLWQPPPKPTPRPYVTSAVYAGKAIDAIARQVATAREGERNKVLFWAGRRMVERISAGQIRQGEATALLAAAAQSAGLLEIEASRTIASAMRAA